MADKQYYLNNPALPTSRASFEYTPKMVRDIKKCGQNILHFAENFFYIIDPDEGKTVINLFKCQKQSLRTLRDNRYNILLASRQIGKTTMLTIYALWVACFNDDQNIVIVANKESTAIEIFRRVRMAYEQLPNWLKPGVIEYGKTSLMLDNGSRIGISTTTGSAARGTSLNVLILDELAFIDPPSIMEDFWRSVWPTISRSKKSKVLIASTPNGTDNLFYKLYDGSMRGENSFVTSVIKWDDVPGRDEEWKKEQIKILGSVESFEQEFNCTFLQKGESSIDAELFEKFKNMCSEAVLSLQDGKYKIWKMPQDNRIYIAGVDVAEGVGQDYSVIQILDITDLTNIEQVACFRSNTIDVPNFTTQLHEILTQWGKPLAMIERNNCGAQVVDNLHHIHKYENIINYGSAVAGRKKEQMGVVAHTNTKHKGVLNMRYWVNELQCVRFNDVNTIQELKEFVRKPNGTWSARGSSKDDCVMSLIWALMALDNDANNGICQRYFEILNVDDNGKPSAIKCMDFGLKYYTRPVHSALSVHAQDADSIASICFGNDTMQSDEMQDLVSAGWQLMQ